MLLKKRLAREIIVQLYTEAEAGDAAARFERIHQRREIPEEINECRVSFDAMRSGNCGEVDLPCLMVAVGLAASKGEAKRLIQQGGVSIEGEKVAGERAPLKSGCVIKAGKRRFARVIDSDILGAS